MVHVHNLAIGKTCDEKFIAEVEERSGQKISRCYQCGNCSASCNYTFSYDYPVSQIMRLIQLGQKSIVLSTRSIWICAACQSCTTRCPNNIDVAKVMETMRVMAREEGTVAQKDVRIFYDEFMESVRRFGRVFETGLLPLFGIKSGKPFTDMDLAPKVLRKGKLTLLPTRIKGRKEVARIYERFEAYRKKQETERQGREGVE
jgi:heterodisulfide reductase subunit C2